MLNSLNKTEQALIILMTALLGVAYLLNLGLLPLRIDESIRTTVAIEMMNSGNYLTPTMWGRYYYSKPPLFNWILIAFFQAFDSVSLFVYRLPSVLSYFGIGLVTWFVSRKHIGQRPAILAAFGFMLSGSVLLRDSMLGYIDPLLSAITLMSFYTIYHFHKQGRYVQLFVFSYLLTAIGVMLKGAPSIAFQGITLLVWFVYKRDFKSLFRPSHFISLGLFAAVVGSFFYFYAQQNDVSNYFSGLSRQAAIRTPAHHAWYETLFYYVVFPFENFGLLLPTSLFTVFAFRKGIIKRWMNNDFLAFTFIVLCANLIPYWLSPGYRFRYLMMLYPLWFILGAEAYFHFKDKDIRVNNILNWIFFAIGIALIPLAGFALISGQIEGSLWLYISLLLLAIAVIVLLLLWFKFPAYRMYYTFIFLALFRIGYDVVWIPAWSSDSQNIEVYKMQQAEEILKAANGRPIQVYSTTPMSRSYAYYLGSKQKRIIEKTEVVDPAYLYLITDSRLPMLEEWDVNVLYRYELRFKTYHVNLVEVTPK